MADEDQPPDRARPAVHLVDATLSLAASAVRSALERAGHDGPSGQVAMSAPGLDNKKAAPWGAANLQSKLVAGAGFEPAAFRL